MRLLPDAGLVGELPPLAWRLLELWLDAKPRGYAVDGVPEGYCWCTAAP
jgi:hypothetical protein